MDYPEINFLTLEGNLKQPIMSNVFKGEVPGFKPSLHGFKFVNSFQLSSLPLGDKIAKGIGQSGYGLCGGMAHCAHELFNFKEPVPQLSQPPQPNNALYAYLVSGLLDSFGPNLRDMNKILDWFAMPNGKTKLPKLTKPQLIALKLMLKRGKLVQLMIAYNTENIGNMWDNHQVLAYKIEEENNKGKIYLYEPNNPLSDNSYIEYTEDAAGVHMKEINDKRVPTTNGRDVYGFFLVFPRLENPLTKPAYLITKGADYLVERMKNNLRKSVYEIVAELKKYSQLSPLEIFRLLKNHGYTATDIAKIGKDSLKLGAEMVLNFLHKVGFTVGQVVAALNIVWNKIASWFVSKLLALKYGLEDIAKGVQEYFRMQLLELVKLLKRAAVKLSDMVVVLKNRFLITNMRTLAKMLKDASYRVQDILKELKKHDLSLNDAINIIRNEFKMSVTASAKLARDLYGNKPKDILIALWKHGNAGINDLINAAKSIFNMGKLQLLKLI